MSRLLFMDNPILKFETKISEVSGVGKYYSEKLEKLGIKNIRDLLFYFPARYEDFTNFKKIEDLEFGETATITGRITNITSRYSWQRKILITEAEISDNIDNDPLTFGEQEETIRAIWFGARIAQNLKVGDKISLAGKISEKDGVLHFSNPFFEKITDDKTELKETSGFLPIYSETKGITSRFIRQIIRTALKNTNLENDPIPQKILKSVSLPELKIALKNIHFPSDFEQIGLAKRRFAFADLLLLELAVFEERKLQEKNKSFQISSNLEQLKKLADSLEFNLTPSQKESAFEILKDIKRPFPMNRLLQGDVGSGKTIIAILVALATTKSGYQTAILAPTEILARQHFNSFYSHLKNFNVRLGLITAKESKWVETDEISHSSLSKKELKGKIKDGEIDIIIGTHVLIQKDIQFKKLAMVVVDEQHRFGVKQRGHLLKNKIVPHFLTMTATPIPRTLALTIWGDLDISSIREKPKERKPVITKIVDSKNRQKANDFIRNEIKKGRQVFVICPLIKESEKIKAKNIESEYKRLKRVFSGFNIAMISGKTESKEKERIMSDFQENKINILLSTSVIEVGIDFPNASVMVIEGAERFGLAQIHQFRGRVGRGLHQSYCFIFADTASKESQNRLKKIAQVKDSFELAEIDLKTRGPGQFLGEKQSGFPDYLMEAIKDISIVSLAKDKAMEILKEDPSLKKYPLLRKEGERFANLNIS